MSKQTITTLEWIIRSVPEFVLNQFKDDPKSYFESFIKDLVTSGVSAIENARNRTVGATETTLTELLIAPLRQGYLIIPEANANGHVDIFVKTLFPGIEWKGEAKILTDYSWYEKGLVKLVAKYNTGSEGNTFMIGYCRKPAMHTIIKDYRTKIEKGRPADFRKWDKLGFEHPNIFVGEHLSSGRSILVTHVWSNCHYATDATVLAAKATKKVPRTTNRAPRAARKTPRKPRRRKTG